MESYITELNAFYELYSRSSLSVSALALWHSLMAISNKARWKNPLPVSREQLREVSKLNDRTVRRAREELQELGLIDFEPQGANRATLYTLHSIANGEYCAHHSAACHRHPP